MMIYRLVFAPWIVLAVSFGVRADPAPQPLPWTKLTEIYYTHSQARMYGYNVSCSEQPTPWNAIFMDTWPSNNYAGCGPHVQGWWYTVDLTALGVPKDAAAAFLSGMILVTPYGGGGTSDIHVSLRPYGDTSDPDCKKYLGQAVSNVGNQNVRSNWSTWIGLSEGKFQWCFRIPNSTDAAYGVNMSVQAWGRASPPQMLSLMGAAPKKRARRTEAPKQNENLGNAWRFTASGR